MIRMALLPVLAAMLPPVPALAQAIDADAVQVLAGPCAECHGPHGRSPGAIPSIAGLPEQQAVDRMLAFRNGTDPAATVMPRLMKGYDETQIRALAHWFAGIGK